MTAFSMGSFASASVIACLMRILPLHLLFDDPVRSRHNVVRNRQSELLRRFQIDHQLELSRLLHEEICGLRALQNSVHMLKGSLEVLAVLSDRMPSVRAHLHTANFRTELGTVF
jgi:hypothetical protein